MQTIKIDKDINTIKYNGKIYSYTAFSYDGGLFYYNTDKKVKVPLANAYKIYINDKLKWKNDKCI